ncbi:hypothetical protein CRUP_029623, partial [Coryphaenoides rupestris]
EIFGKKIACRTGVYDQDDKVPSKLLNITLRYGKSTSVSVKEAFQFLENPILMDHHPKSSFDCGGRSIRVVGSGFDIIQEAVMAVKAVGGENQHAEPIATQPLRAYVHLDNQRRELKPFDYYPDPTFHDLPKKVITENSIISVTAAGFSKAIRQGAQGTGSDVSACVNTLQDDKLLY